MRMKSLDLNLKSISIIECQLSADFETLRYAMMEKLTGFIIFCQLLPVDNAIIARLYSKAF